MTPEQLNRIIFPAAFAFLPAEFDTPAARALLISIALQESRLKYRIQIVNRSGLWWEKPHGPARGLYQFEMGGGVAGVMAHPASRGIAAEVLDTLNYPFAAAVAHEALAFDDILATCFARLLLRTLPGALPGKGQHDESWGQYISAWRPGKPHPETWRGFYDTAWGVVA